jgi:hypothetical protein
MNMPTPEDVCTGVLVNYEVEIRLLLYLYASL